MRFEYGFSLGQDVDFLTTILRCIFTKMHDIYPKRCYWSGKKQEDRFGPPPSTQEILGTRTPLRADSTYDTPIRIYERFPLFVARMKLTLKPVIREMVRTGVIVPKVTLLVDKIIIVQLSTSADSSSVIAYRMYLTDGDKSIQGKYISIIGFH